MAYNVANPPVAISMGPLAGFNTTEGPNVGGKIWLYKSADPIGTVDAAGYFTNGLGLGMQVGDIVFVYDSVNNWMYFAFVTVITPTPGASAVAGTGTATINSTTLVVAK